MRTAIIATLILIAQVCNAQIDRWHLSKTNQDSIYGYIRIMVDTIKGDTAKYHQKTGRYLEISKEDIVLIDGHKMGGMGTKCGCEPLPHGYWIEKYRNGHLKEQGRYLCSKKIGTWIFYHENGQIKKVENYKNPYIDIFTEDTIFGNLRTDFLLEGPYLEYYPNGQLKTEGKYEIIEEFSGIDTIYTFDMDTYEPISHVVRGQFWIPKSKKSGFWNHYSESGELISHQLHELKTWKDDKIRSIESRYWDIILDLCCAN